MLSAPAPDRPDSHLRNCRRSLRYAALVWVDRHVCTKSSTASEKRTRHLWARPMESVGIASIVRSAPLCQSNESSPSSPGQTHAPCPVRRGVRIRGLTWMVPAAGASVARQARGLSVLEVRWLPDREARGLSVLEVRWAPDRDLGLGPTSTFPTSPRRRCPGTDSFCGPRP